MWALGGAALERLTWMTSELVYFRLQPPGVFCRVTEAGIQATSPADRASVFMSSPNQGDSETRLASATPEGGASCMWACSWVPGDASLQAEPLHHLTGKAGYHAGMVSQCKEKGRQTAASILVQGEELGLYRGSDAHLSLGLPCRSHRRTPVERRGPAWQGPIANRKAGSSAAVHAASVMRPEHATACIACCMRIWVPASTT